ncbi:MAG TPA: cupin domain-containing protein [Sphingomonadaceae bacterium]|jgi:mannose-6-phosphate isomerase-like protein (cupin superfamily)|nr:cupin domain-containing protein [Sphingomonadaceae bacterium]
MPVERLIDHPIHLGRGGRAVREPRFEGGMDWYADYGARHADDGAEGRLVSEYRFTESWEGWERHPHGEEVVYCLAGTLTLYQEQEDGRIEQVVLHPGEYAINPPGVWHTADVAGEVKALFITAGEGTEHKPR